jgi:two-component system, NarL family, nitrate/nitrite response regulator NarL
VNTDLPVIKIAVYDQNPMLALGICSLLEKHPSVRAVSVMMPVQGIATQVADYDIAIIDPSQTDLAPSEIATILTAHGGTVRLIGYFGEVSVITARACIAAGFRGFLPKTAALDALQTAIAAVQGGALYIDATFADLLYEPPALRPSLRSRDLTDREAYVLKSVARGKSLKEIGQELALSSKTIETYKARGSTKLNLQGRRAIVEYAIRSGWVQ